MKDRASRTRLALILLGLCGAGLGFYSTHGRAITLDESVTLHIANHALRYDLSELFQEIHTPSYDVALCLWLKAFGIGLPSAMAFSILLALLSLGCVFWAARRLWNDEVALFASLLLAFSPLHVFYSQYARTYAYFIAVSCLSSFSYLLLNRAAEKRAAILYALSTYLLITSHVAAFAVVAAQWIHWMLMKATSRGGMRVQHWVGLHSLLAVLYLPFLWIILHRYDLSADVARFYSWVKLPGPGSLLEGFIFLAGSSALLAVVFAALAALAVWKAMDSDRVYLLLWLFFPMSTLFVLSWTFHPLFIHRGFSPSAVPLLVLAALGLCRIKFRLIRVAVLICAVLVSLSVIRKGHFMEPEDWKKVADRLQETESSGPVFVRPSYAALPLSYYLKRECFFARSLEGCLQAGGVYPVTTAADVTSHLKGKGAWLVGYDVDQEGNRKLVGELVLQRQVQPSPVTETFESIDLIKLD